MSDLQGEMPSTAPQAGANQNEAVVQETEAEFDAKRAMALIEKLRAQVKELTPKAKQAEQLAAERKAKEEAEMTENQKLSKRLAEVESELSATRRAALSNSIAAKIGLPAAFADRLRGETAEELEADAKAILEALPKSQKQPGPVPLNPGANGQTGESAADRTKRLYGETTDIWAPRPNGIDWTALKKE